jgi:hypothetical protein
MVNRRNKQSPWQQPTKNNMDLFQGLISMAQKKNGKSREKHKNPLYRSIWRLLLYLMETRRL